MKGHIFKPNCKCDRTKKCTCGAKWAYIVDVGRVDPKTGKRKQEKKNGFRTRKEAEEALAILLSEVANGTYVKEANITFEDFSKDWLKAYAGTGRVMNIRKSCKNPPVVRAIGFLISSKVTKR
jgi:hypothetical protein